MFRQSDGGFSESFGPVSREERRQADRFFADLLGIRPVGSRPFTSAENWIPEPHFPPRKDDALGGAAFMKEKIWSEGPLSKAQKIRRENAIVAALLDGNMPRWLLRWRTITVQEDSPKVEVRVLPDYLCVGSDTDYRHVPLDQQSAQRVADVFGAVLPTAKICHAIYRRTLKRRRIGAIMWWQRPNKSWAQDSTAGYDWHSVAIQEKAAGVPVGKVIAGHKKDVVLSNRHNADKRHKDDAAKIAFHGFYGPTGIPFEPCREPGYSLEGCKEYPALAHPEFPGHFVDYSQGVRLVHPLMHIDGVPQPVEEVLKNEKLNKLISAEGTIVPARVPRPPV